jgi:predicted ATP-binding protein involved in virulence
MKIERLKLANVRAFEQAEFEFGDGVNLLVGINGVGKSTVLDSLRFLLSNALKQRAKNREKTFNFKIDDISVGLTDENPALTAQLTGFINDSFFSHRIEKHSKKFVLNPNWRGELKNQTIKTPDVNELTFDFTAPLGETKPIAVFFSPHRSIVSRRKGSGEASFSKHSLEPRELQIQEFASWLLAREKTEGEAKTRNRQIAALRDALKIFLENCRDLQAVAEPKPTLTIEKDSKTLNVSQLSDGERGVLTLVFDLTARLTEANPQLENPREGVAVVLIDELDLHLHPQWQREIVDRLEATFPNCQFIATTHSPQIIGEVKPEKIYILGKNGKKPYKPNQSLGMDTNWILDRLMKTKARDSDTQKDLKKIEKLIKSEQYSEAQKKIDELRQRLGDFSDLIELQAIKDIYT